MLSRRNTTILGLNTCQGHWITDLIAISDIHSPLTCAFTPFLSLMLLKKETLKENTIQSCWHSPVMWAEQVGQCWQAQGSPLPVWTLGSLHCPRFWQSREWQQRTWTRGFPHAVLNEELLCNFSTEKESTKGGWLLKDWGLKHRITSLHKNNLKKSMCTVSGIPSRSHLINKCREQSLSLHIATSCGFFKSSYYKKFQVFAGTSDRAKHSSSHVPTFKIYFYLAVFSLSQVFCHNKLKQRLFYCPRYSMAFVFLPSAGTSEDCIQGAKCARPRVKAAEYTNLRKHRQWIANDTQNKTGKKTFTQKTTKELHRYWIGFLYTLILLNCVW